MAKSSRSSTSYRALSSNGRVCIRNWVRPQGQLDNIGAILEKSASSCAILALPQHASIGSATAESRERLQLLIPHVQRAILIGKAFDLRKAVAEDFGSTIDAVAAAIFLIDSRGNIAHANRSGLALLAADDVVQATNGRLRVLDRPANQALNDVLGRLATCEDLASHTGTPAIHLPSRGGTHYVGHVLPLTGGERRKTGQDHHAVAAIFIHKAAQDLASPPEVLAKAYGLTPRELGVLLAVVQAAESPTWRMCWGCPEQRSRRTCGKYSPKQAPLGRPNW